MILAVGTKLQAIITRMALDIQQRHAVVQGIPLVQVSDKHFWFGWPQLVLYLIHFVLFQVYFALYCLPLIIQLQQALYVLRYSSNLMVFCFVVQNAFELTYFLWTWVINYSHFLPLDFSYYNWGWNLKTVAVVAV